MPHAPASRIGLALATVYLAWGTTYLAIRVAVDALPPLLMASARLLVAGAILYLVLRWRGAPPPTRRHWRSAGLLALLLPVPGNGGVAWAEQHVPSALTAVLVATVPLWVVLGQSLRPGARPPRAPVVAALVAGFVGVALLADPRAQAVDPRGAIVLLAASVLWALGTLRSPRAHLPDSPLLGAAMEMLVGGAILAVAGAAAGEARRLDLGAAPAEAWLALAYLVAVGSLLGYGAFVWLTRSTTPARAATYAYVNPVVALLVGWGLGGEALDGRILLSALLIVASAAVVITARDAPAPARPTPAPAAPVPQT